jgi:glycolate oxidase iron-sulfur subunit
MAGAETSLQERAKQTSARSIDISEFLAKQELRPIPMSKPLRIAYHDACHLAHAQRVRSAPRKLLQQIPGVMLLEIRDGHFCCGSAGLYNIQQPELAAQLGRRKAERIIELKPDIVALGNIGCEIQIERDLRELGSNVPVLHTMEILDRAYSAAVLDGD